MNAVPWSPELLRERIHKLVNLCIICGIELAEVRSCDSVQIGTYNASNSTFNISSKKEGDVEPIYFIYLTPIVAIVALVFAYLRAAWITRQDQGTDRMKLIGS